MALEGAMFPFVIIFKNAGKGILADDVSVIVLTVVCLRDLCG